MSAIGAIFNFHQRPFDAENLRDLTALWHALHKWGPDGGRIVTTDFAGFCYQAFNTNREARLEKQPLVERDGRILTADVRIDNRAELFAATHNLLNSRSTDVDYLIAAHRQWGTMFPLNVVGEYAFVLYEQSKRRLLFCRDHVGARPLYYHHDKHRLIVSSQLAPLLDLSGISRDINEEYVAGYIARGPRVGLTPYKHIHSVLPAHVHTVTESGCLTEKRYWQLEPGREVRFSSDAEYEEAFRHHLRYAVQAPLRTDRPVMIELSGGLDSSTVACVAAERIRNKQVEATRFDTLSYVYDESPTSDESRFIHIVEGHLGQTGTPVRDEDSSLLPPPDADVDAVSPNPMLCSFGYYSALCRLMQESGARVLLTGIGGDQILGASYDPYPLLADLVVSRKPAALHHGLRLWSQTLDRPYISLLWHKAIVPVLPRELQPWCRREAMNRLPSWFNPDFVARTRLREQRLPVPDPFGFRLPSERDRALSYLSVIKSIAPCYRQELTCLDSSHPFVHRPLVEFLQAIPVEQFLRPGENRSLMRRALREVLPEKIVRRKTKGDPSEGLARAIAREAPMMRSLFTDARVCAYGFMDSAPLLAAIGRAKNGLERYAGALLFTISLEFWLRALEQRPAAKNYATVGEEPQFAMA
ncbi:MAG TPA: asparagine synthase-related protein [Pyrinomonadaceae bacterium]|nr:asparagine synthase-related protein [Pyrinomonadaceae bacterium]